MWIYLKNVFNVYRHMHTICESSRIRSTIAVEFDRFCYELMNTNVESNKSYIQDIPSMCLSRLESSPNKTNYVLNLIACLNICNAVLW